MQESLEEVYLKKLLSEIEVKKKEGKKGLFKIGEKINHNIANYVKDYFEGSQEYSADVHSCAGCKSSRWDIVILFK